MGSHEDRGVGLGHNRVDTEIPFRHEFTIEVEPPVSADVRGRDVIPPSGCERRTEHRRSPRGKEDAVIVNKTGPDVVEAIRYREAIAGEEGLRNHEGFDIHPHFECPIVAPDREPRHGRPHVVVDTVEMKGLADHSASVSGSFVEGPIVGSYYIGRSSIARPPADYASGRRYALLRMDHDEA